MRLCPLCKTKDKKFKIFLKEKIDKNLISKFSYASRKNPEFMRHKLIQCSICDIVYAANPPKKEELANAYHLSDFDSNQEANDAAISYLKSIKPILNKMQSKKSVLEIGCGTGIFLQLLKKEGFSILKGIEPSASAINAAPKNRKSWFIKGIFNANNFKPNSFDLVCCFMTMEHVYDPLDTAKNVRKILRPGGIFVTVTHDYRHIINKALGEKSPIIDIEHMQIFSNKSIRETFKKAKFKEIETVTFCNNYNLTYWIRLTPLPRYIKEKIIILIHFSPLKNFKLKFNVGNTMTHGIK